MSPDKLRLTVLGSGTSTGVPVLGCSCGVCKSKDPRNQRTRCSALLEWSGRRVLIDTATDFRQQALREGLDRLDCVLFTHTHADHIHGIDDLRTFSLVNGAAIPVYATRTSLATIRRVFAYIFTDESEPGYRPRLSLHEINGSFELYGQKVVPIPLEHGPGEAFGFRVGGLAYLTDCSGIPEGSWPLLRDIEVLVIDALRFREHASHLNIAGAIKIAEQFGARRTLLTHLSHDVDVNQHAQGLPEGVEFAYDGQVITLPLQTS
jgi:phosphoribosyl 1,2-cyclic phosphate phosphodiesterase